MFQTHRSSDRNSQHPPPCVPDLLPTAPVFQVSDLAKKLILSSPPRLIQSSRLQPAPSPPPPPPRGTPGNRPRRLPLPTRSAAGELLKEPRRTGRTGVPCARGTHEPASGNNRAKERTRLGRGQAGCHSPATALPMRALLGSKRAPWRGGFSTILP